VTDPSSFDTKRYESRYPQIWHPRIALIVAFLIPLKLSLAYIVLAPGLILWGANAGLSLLASRGTRSTTPLISSLILFQLSVFISSCLGFDPAHSIKTLLSFSFFSLTIGFIASAGNGWQILLMLVLGQSVAALHTVIESAFPNLVGNWFIGDVSESGQLALVIPALLGMIYSAYSAHSERRFYLISALPLLTAALLINLKRGPWCGVIVGASIFLISFASRTTRFVSALIVASCFFLPPVYNRILDSSDHFFISGGRSTIWQIGLEFIAKYPLGVGYHNSRFLQRFSLEIPKELKHFHSNILNIVAENGWLSGIFFVAFIFSAISLCWRKPHNPLHVAIGCGLLSWQIAGLVEYNFGDSEVLLTAWILLGVVLGQTGLRRDLKENRTPTEPSPNDSNNDLLTRN